MDVLSKSECFMNGRYIHHKRTPKKIITGNRNRISGTYACNLYFKEKQLGKKVLENGFHSWISVTSSDFKVKLETIERNTYYEFQLSKRIGILERRI